MSDLTGMMSGYLSLEQRVDVVRILRHLDVITDEVAEAAITELKRELRAEEEKYWARRQSDWDEYRALPRWRRFFSMRLEMDPQPIRQGQPHWDEI